MKKLEDLTIQELWHLFPIELVKHSDNWSNYFNEEKAILTNLLKDYNPTINHIGSTSIPNIMAKPIIDILINFDKSINIKDIKNILINNGYICMNESDTSISLNKGYTINGYEDKVYHIHLRYNNDIDELYFKNYLIKHPKVSKKYEHLKKRLSKKYKYNRDLYTYKKTQFIRKHTKKGCDEHYF